MNPIADTPATDAAQPAPPRAAASAATPARARRRPASGRYFVCLGVLVLCGIGMLTTSEYLEAYFRKLPLPLKAHLYAMDRARLLPEYDLFRIQPEPLDHEMVTNLGTDEYLQWAIVDRSKEPRDRTSLGRLFVSYYTGQPDMVPHEPRECMVASGWQLKSDQTTSVPVSYKGKTLEIPVSVLGFAPPAAQGKADDPTLTVMFFFYANGSFETTRLGVRTATQDLRDRYAFYSKIEVSFTDQSQGYFAGHDDSIAAVRKLLQKVMPILLDDHYPDWEAVQAGRVEAAPTP